MSELVKLVVFVPETHADAVRKAMGDATGGRDRRGDAGAGKLGKYSHCSFSTKGTGRFTPLAGSDPAIGQIGKPEAVAEERVEITCERSQVGAIVKAIKAVHPYEEAVIDVYPLMTI